MNEGHSAFLALERLRHEDLDRVRATTVFTTHTPVPAGNEVFDEELVASYLGEDVLELGAWEEPGFGMTPFALRMSAHANGVSELHGEVAREMWAGIDTPIGHVTNGVHPGTWVAPEIEEADDLWEAHRLLKARLVERTGLDPELLTIGPAASPPTSAPVSSSPTSSGCSRCRCRSSSPARRIPPTRPARTSCRRSSS
jgi:hypothetical protein